MGLTVVLEGTKELMAVLKRLGTRAPVAAGRALFREAEAIMTSAKGRTPVDTGALQGSGHVELPDVDMTGAQVVLGFGGAAAPYAIFVHEDLTARHTVGEAKFLEKSVDEARRGMEQRLAADLRRELEQLAR